MGPKSSHPNKLWVKGYVITFYNMRGSICYLWQPHPVFNELHTWCFRPIFFAYTRAGPVLRPFPFGFFGLYLVPVCDHKFSFLFLSSLSYIVPLILPSILFHKFSRIVEFIQSLEKSFIIFSLHILNHIVCLCWVVDYYIEWKRLDVSPSHSMRCISAFRCIKLGFSFGAKKNRREKSVDTDEVWTLPGPLCAYRQNWLTKST